MTDAWQWIVIIWLALVALAFYRRIRFLEENYRIHREVTLAIFKTLLKAGMVITIEETDDGNKERSSKETSDR